MMEQLTHRFPIHQLFVLVVAWILSSCSKPEEQARTPSGENPENVQSAAQEVVPAPEIPIGKVVDWESEIDNPSTDGWQSEVNAAAANKQLDQLGRLLGSGASAGPSEFAPLALPPIGRSVLYPNLENVFDSGLVSVARLKDGRGIRAMAFDPNKDTNFHSKFKIVSVNSAEESFTTTQLVSMSWQTADALVEQHSTWVTTWSQQSSPPKIKSLEITKFEQTHTRLDSGRTLFSDCTESALGANPSYREQLLYGLNHWHERMPHLSILNSMSAPGIALGDVNGDGLDDLYLCQDPRLPNRLFLQNPDGTMRDVSAEWGVDWLEDSRSALIVDLDNDGDRDLAVAILGHVIVA
ncbi:MAG: hypothetical protein ACI8XO_003774, partial [Verrucomicrobiales bacterium]